MPHVHYVQQAFTARRGTAEENTLISAKEAMHLIRQGAHSLSIKVRDNGLTKPTSSGTMLCVHKAVKQLHVVPAVMPSIPELDALMKEFSDLFR